MLASGLQCKNSILKWNLINISSIIRELTNHTDKLMATLERKFFKMRLRPKYFILYQQNGRATLNSVIPSALPVGSEAMYIRSSISKSTSKITTKSPGWLTGKDDKTTW